RSTRLDHWPTPTRTGVRGSSAIDTPADGSGMQVRRLEERGGCIYNPHIDILLVCTANQCRSPMAEGLLRRILALSGVGAEVGSAGLLPGGAPATPEAIATMAARRIDISGHVSRTVDVEMARTTTLIIGMTRQHVRELCETYG